MDHAAADDLAEDLRYPAAKFVEIDVAADLTRDGCYSFAVEPARNDQVEPAQVGVRVEGEAVGRHPLLHPDADRADLPVANPGAGHPLLTPRRDPVAGDAADHDLFQLEEVLLEVGVERGQVEDGIADDLPRSVVGHVAAARGLDDFDVGARPDQVLPLRRLAERDDG